MGDLLYFALLLWGCGAMLFIWRLLRFNRKTLRFLGEVSRDYLLATDKIKWLQRENRSLREQLEAQNRKSKIENQK